MSYSSLGTVAVTAKREMALAAKNRGIIVSVALMLILVLGLIGLGMFFDNRDAEVTPDEVAVVDVAPESFTGTGVDAVTVADRAAAEEAVLSGDVEAAVLPADDGWELLVDGTASLSVSSAVNQAVTAAAMNDTLAAFGVDPAEFAETLPAATVTETDLSDDGSRSEGDLATLTVAFVAVLLSLSMIIFFAANIGSRVTEEKSSRVVELILAAVRPLDFLAGKILGNALFGLLASFLLIGIGAAALAASGLVAGISFDWTVLPLVLLAFIIGMIFFGSLYAAAGAMVQRTEDLQTTQGPVMILLLAVIYVAAFSFSFLDATWVQVVAWIPPISGAMAPLQYAAGNMTLWEALAALGIYAVVTFGALWLVAKIYRAAILNNGAKMTWRQAITAKTA